MIGIISPAMNMRIEERPEISLSEPHMMEKAERIYEELKRLQPWEIQNLMKVNDKIALQAFLDFQDWKKGDGAGAVFAYDGLVFKNIDAGHMTEDQWEYLNRHVRILSGLYGVLKPFDRIRPYRLEMASPLKIDGRNLYRFWGSDLAEEIFKTGEPVINLASEEYAKAIRKYREPADRWIDIEFLTRRNGKLRTITAWAKMARGRMARFMAERQADDPEELKEFEFQGYEFEEALSTEQKFVFVSR